jgi:hypothetical protein
MGSLAQLDLGQMVELPLDTDRLIELSLER